MGTFENDNARYLSPSALISTFVPTQSFWRLLSAKNHVVLGSRGSGKTALARMLSHDLLRQLKSSRAQSIIRSASFIGVYVAMDANWVATLTDSPREPTEQLERFFRYRLNIAACLGLLDSINSCLSTYISDPLERLRTETELIEDISAAWSGGAFKCDSVTRLRNFLEGIDYNRLQQRERWHFGFRAHENEEPIGLAFDIDLFAPVKRAISLANAALHFTSDTTWLLCLDEAEFLNPDYHRLINTQLRSATPGLNFKMTTMPYHHFTLDTNVPLPLDVGHDFSYIYIDRDPITYRRSGEDFEGETFAEHMFNKRKAMLPASFRHAHLKTLLGDSRLLDRKSSDWEPKSIMYQLLERHGSAATVARANRLQSQSTEFKDQISRKLHGALLLREEFASSGNVAPSLYSGTELVATCADMNPRRLVALFNLLLHEYSLSRPEPTYKRGRGFRLERALPPTVQHRVLTTYSTNTLERVQSEKHIGLELYDFLRRIGTYMQHFLHERPLGTDFVSSIRLTRDTDVSTWRVVERAVGLGLLYPNVNMSNPDPMPHGAGVFHLAYVLAPCFHLLPRRGSDVTIRTLHDELKITSSDETVVQPGLLP